jgi:Fe-S-cluster containining protein
MTRSAPHPSDAILHPCLRCGACCAAFRVAFHWSEAAPHHPGGPDESLTVRVRPFEVAMRGTEGGAAVRCVALVGEVGREVACTVYARRPSPCRALQAAWEHGEPSPQCDRARARHGLPPLRPDDFPGFTPGAA